MNNNYIHKAVNNFNETTKQELENKNKQLLDSFYDNNREAEYQKYTSNFKYEPVPSLSIEIEGVMDVTIDHDKFLQEFYKWLESNNWTFLGITKELDGND